MRYLCGCCRECRGWWMTLIAWSPSSPISLLARSEARNCSDFWRSIRQPENSCQGLFAGIAATTGN